MKSNLRSGIFWISALLFSLSSFAQTTSEWLPGKKHQSSTILADYVHKPDSTYRYEIVKTIKVILLK
ncbi:MAG: hypothetical protein C0433_15315 [Cyclobacterium sp.]|nr:hypothetical protein [Cyclobacterium sp.]